MNFFRFSVDRKSSTSKKRTTHARNFQLTHTDIFDFFSQTSRIKTCGVRHLKEEKILNFFPILILNNLSHFIQVLFVSVSIESFFIEPKHCTPRLLITVEISP